MEKTTEYGTIKIADNVFEKMAKEAVSKSDGRDEFAEGRKSVIIEDRTDELLLEFHVVHRFGTSLLLSSRLVLDDMERSIRSLGLKKPVRVVMKVVAVRARKLQKRDLEFVRIVK